MKWCRQSQSDEIFEALEGFNGGRSTGEALLTRSSTMQDDIFTPDEVFKEESWTVESAFEEAGTPRSYSALGKLWAKARGKTCTPGMTHAECLGQEADKLIRRLQKAGFYKFQVDTVENVSYRSRDKIGTVENISIADQEDFKRGTEFPFDAKIHILRREFKQVPVGFTPRQLQKTNVCDTKAYFKHQGFGVVKSVPIPDLKMGWLKLDGQVERVLVDGFDIFRADSLFPVDAEITIYFHTYKRGSQ